MVHAFHGMAAALNALPVAGILGELKDALGGAVRSAVLQAPPGSGKTTMVALALLKESWLEGRRILLLEPRRLAARAAASRMAALQGEEVGGTVGLRVRLESRVGSKTRIEVITEGVLTRRLQSDPALEGVGLVIFDEFHERHLECDLGLALCLDMQGVLNPGLRLLVMSATLDTAPVARMLGGAAVISCSGRMYAVEKRHLPRRLGLPIERQVAETILGAVRAGEGSVLAFLPGAAEIRRTANHLSRAGLPPQWMLLPLHGKLSRQEQDRALLPCPAGRYKVVLASAIAETSLTIEGVRVVVDSGLMRVPQYDLRSGMTRLRTVPVSRASAEQRSGRAGRTAPGLCLRLWSEAAHTMLSEQGRPEILDVDLSGLLLELAAWGVSDPARLRWLDPPPPAAVQVARDLLVSLGALDGEGRISAHGRQMARLPLHPRLAHMLLAARERGQGTLACLVAAILGEREVLRLGAGQRDADLRWRVERVESAMARPEHGPIGSAGIETDACRRVAAVAGNLRRYLGLSDGPANAQETGAVLAWAYPDRIGLQRSGERGRFLLSGGQGAFLDPEEPLAGERFLVAAELDGERREARIFLAATIDLATIEKQFAALIRQRDRILWDNRREAVAAARIRELGALVLSETPLEHADPEQACLEVMAQVRRRGLADLPWSKAARRLRQRVGFLRRVLPEQTDWPDLSDGALLQSLPSWLAPRLTGVTRWRDLERVDLYRALLEFLPAAAQKRLDHLAPTHLDFAGGPRLPLDYSGEVPVLAVRLQQVFGLEHTPLIAQGRVSVLLHLLSPAGRPLQVTSDLPRFWRELYPEVRRQLRGRYPKHPWPEDPLAARFRPAKTAKPARPSA